MGGRGRSPRRHMHALGPCVSLFGFHVASAASPGGVVLRGGEGGRGGMSVGLLRGLTVPRRSGRTRLRPPGPAPRLRAPPAPLLRPQGASNTSPSAWPAGGGVIRGPGPPSRPGGMMDVHVCGARCPRHATVFACLLSSLRAPPRALIHRSLHPQARFGPQALPALWPGLRTTCPPPQPLASQVRAPRSCCATLNCLASCHGRAWGAAQGPWPPRASVPASMVAEQVERTRLPAPLPPPRRSLSP